MTREADVVRSVVEMADTLVDDYDVVAADRTGGPVRQSARRLGRRGDAGLSRGQPGAGGLLERGDAPTLSIVQHRASAEALRLNEQLSAALTSRVVIEQAKGVIAERADVDLAQASPGCGPTPATATCA